MPLKMCAVLISVVACCCSVQAASVNITMSADKQTVAIGETGILFVYGEVVPTVTGDGIFGWDVDLIMDPTNIVELLAATLDAGGWDGGGSSGTVVSSGLDAIYDTSFVDSEKGVGSPVRLFSIQFRGSNLGSSTLTIGPDYTQGADFVTHQGIGDDSGNYTNASLTVTVIPEPASMSLLTLAGLALIYRRKR